MEDRKCWLAIGALAALMALALSWPVWARDNGEWSSSPTFIREWFQSLMQPDNPHMSCCDEPDAFAADTFDQENGHWTTDGKGVIGNGTRVLIPDGKLKRDKGDPTGHGIVPIGAQGQVCCYVTPGGIR
jgi:hypothetical protein